MVTTNSILTTNRAATKALLAELGFDPGDVLDRRGDAALDWDEETGEFVLEIIQRDEDGKPIRDYHDIRTREVRVSVTDERLNAYRAALWPLGRTVAP
jgi:hypothetical protein